MKNHTIVFILIAVAIITAALIALTYFVGIGNPQENRGATTVPNQDAASGNQSYFTPNHTASQENTENIGTGQATSAAASAAADASTGSDAENTYVVKAYNGIIGVFSGGSDTPIQTVDVNISSLPESDQQSLTEGISVNGTDALRRLLEDYES